MRTTRRFTPNLLRRWEESGRGDGIHEDYQPWHQVTRGDPSSRGRSHIINLVMTGRQHHLLSDGEAVAFYFAMMLPGVMDIREQFPLCRESGQHELCTYDAYSAPGKYPGTVEISNENGIRHPVVSNGVNKELWHLTTDLLVTQKIESGKHLLLAISVKPTEWNRNRAVELLKLEREYWTRRNVQWLLITPEQYQKKVADCLRRTASWVCSYADPSVESMHRCLRVVARHTGESLTQVLRAISQELEIIMHGAQVLFWKSVWRGLIPLDLRRGWRPTEEIVLISQEEFLELNPIVARRSTCLI